MTNSGVEPAVSRSMADADAADQAGSLATAATFRLANGMQVVVIPDRRSPIVTHMVWYRNGSGDDPWGKSGVAHFLEHLMFKGTHSRPAGTFSAWLSSVGGEENAFTGWDFTGYHQRVPKKHLDACMAYEADRMRNLVLDEATVATEREVILAERGMIVDAHPAERLGEVMALSASPAHPAGRPIIGWRHEIEALTLGDALAYYRRFYTPENAILVVAGDAEPAVVLRSAEANYGMIPPTGTASQRHRLQDPPIHTHSHVTLVDETVRQPRFRRLHMVPSPRSGSEGESAALEVLAFLLGGDHTSVLHERLVVETRCATAVGATYWSGYFSERSRFNIHATPAPGFSLDTLDRAVEAELGRLRRTGFERDAVARAKTQLVADALYARDSQVVLAHWYGSGLCCGLSLDHLETWQHRIEAVTPEALARALAHLDPRSGVSGHLVGAAAA